MRSCLIVGMRPPLRTLLLTECLIKNALTAKVTADGSFYRLSSPLCRVQIACLQGVGARFLMLNTFAACLLFGKNMARAYLLSFCWLRSVCSGASLFFRTRTLAANTMTHK